MARRHTILVVDDEVDVVTSVQDLLRLDYRVLGATRAQEGLQLIHDLEVHIVMTDQRMPGMSGVEFLRRVREQQPDAVRLLFTGYADIKAVIDAINQGNVFRYVTKPWDPDELQSIIRQAADQYDLLVERKQLLAELQNKNQELQLANAELRQANSLKDAFIKVASHELRTPLTILLGLTDLALRSPDLKPPLDGWLQSTNKASLRLHHLVNQLFKMLAAGKFERPLERSPTDLALLLRLAADDVQPFLAQRRQEMALDLAPGLGTVNVEATKIRDSVDHLLLNAIKFTPDSGRIQLRAWRGQDREVKVQVSDTGIGIEPASLPHIFEPFFTRMDVSRHTSGQFEFDRRGLGLGLSLVKAFVEMHDGRVDVESTPGQGSKFTVTLPDGGARLAGRSGAPA
jgi:signal transduction histidine kinase